jgi:hypothetical protein
MRMTTLRAVVMSLLFVITGFIGAAIKYWRWWPSHTTDYFMTSVLVCPLCPNVDGYGTDWQKFVSRTFTGGILNALPALIVGRSVVVIMSVHKRKSLSC